MIEIWKRCPVAPDYLVSSFGRVARDAGGQGARPWHEIKQYLPADKRPTVTIRVAGKTKTFRVCNLVAETFLGPRPLPKHETCHEDGNPENNRADNLRWGSRTSNHADMKRHGTARIGEKHHNAKLTETDIAAIRLAVANGELQRVVAERYGVAQSAISKIINGKRWCGH